MLTPRSSALRILALFTICVSLCGLTSVAPAVAATDPASPPATATAAPPQDSTATPAPSTPATSTPAPGPTTGTPAPMPSAPAPAPSTSSPAPSAPAPAPSAPAPSPSAPAPAPAPKKVLYVAVPHPDDEFEAAGQYADSPGTFKVFVLMTRGESTYHCEPVGYQLSILAGAAPAAVTPLGMHTPSCEQDRLASWIGYFTAMSAADPSLPGDFSAPVTTRAFPSGGAQLSREPRAPERAKPAGATPWFTDTTAQVWTDVRGRGVLIDFDLGDGDLTPAKVTWAMKTVLANRAEFGIDPALPDDGVVGAYSNLGDRGCFVYTHPDHAAIAAALRTSDFGLRRQQVATCRTDPGATVTHSVPADELAAAYPADGSAGAFAVNYGWLETPVISRSDQSSLFMGVQSFDVRHQHLADSRVAGSDRFSTASAISEASYPGTAPVVYIASASNYPDALSAGAAAAKQGGPLLLTSPDSLPAVVSTEIARLKPATVVIVGGENAVAPAVATHLAALAPSVVRIAGADRYDTSRKVAAYAFPAGSAHTAYVAGGGSFPDALSATGAAGTQGAPVLLIAPGDPTGATVAGGLATLKPTSIVVVGGTGVVPASVDKALAAIAPVHRLAGADRFATNAAVIRSVFTSAGSALVASGLNFPDALTGAAWAGHSGAPLVLAAGGCLAKPASDALYDLGTTSLTLLGGTSVVGADVAAGVIC